MSEKKDDLPKIKSCPIRYVGKDETGRAILELGASENECRPVLDALIGEKEIIIRVKAKKE